MSLRLRELILKEEVIKRAAATESSGFASGALQSLKNITNSIKIAFQAL
jgi:hypothetical protein